MSADSIEVSQLSRSTISGGLSGAHWDPLSRKIKVEQSLLDSAGVIALALILGHESVHAKFDTVEARLLAPAEYCDSEIRAHNQEVTAIIPALGAALKHRGQFGDFERVTLDLYETNARFASLTHRIRKDLYISFEHNFIPRIRHFSISNAEVNQEIFDLLKGLNSAWKTTIEMRPRGRHEYVQDLGSFLQALEKASAHTSLSPIFSGHIEQLRKGRLYKHEAGQLAEKADKLAEMQARLR